MIEVKTRIFPHLKKNTTFTQRSNDLNEIYYKMRARNSTAEVLETLSTYSIFHTFADDEVMHAYAYCYTISATSEKRLHLFYYVCKIRVITYF